MRLRDVKPGMRVRVRALAGQPYAGCVGTVLSVEDVRLCPVSVRLDPVGKLAGRMVPDRLGFDARELEVVS